MQAVTRKAPSKSPARPKARRPTLARTGRGKPSELDTWNRLGVLRLNRILKAAQGISGLRALGPKLAWNVGVEFVGRSRMTELNTVYRRKAYPTDVLSFPAPTMFRKAGHLGELVICLPVLKEQGREIGHGDKAELQV